MNNNEENKTKIDIIIELQKKLLEEMTISNSNQGQLINEIKELRLENNKTLLTQNALMEEIKEIKINQGTNNSAIELLMNELKSYKEKENNQIQEKYDDKENKDKE